MLKLVKYIKCFITLGSCQLMHYETEYWFCRSLPVDYTCVLADLLAGVDTTHRRILR